MEKLAVCALILNSLGQVLCVSRKTDPNDFGLPGGKVDPGETLVAALEREVMEETGLTITNLEKIFSENDGEYVTTTFTCEYSGSITTSEKGVVTWKTWEELIGSGSFTKYNTSLYIKFLLEKIAKMKNVLAVANEALCSSYDVTQWPANGETEQEKAIALIGKIIK